MSIKESNSTIYDETLKKLEEMFPGQLLLSIDDLARATGIEKRTLYKSTGSKATKKIPIKPIRSNTRLLRFNIFDVAKMLSNS